MDWEGIHENSQMLVQVCLLCVLNVLCSRKALLLNGTALSSTAYQEDVNV